jgi:hypothetical protein
VIGTDAFASVSNSGLLADKERSEIGQSLYEAGGIFHTSRVGRSASCLSISHCPPGESAAHADKANSAGRVVLRLSQQIAGHQRWIGRIIRYHQDLRRPCRQICAAAAEKLAFRFGNVFVAGSADKIHRLYLTEPEGHQRRGLNTTQYKNPVGPAFSMALIVAGQAPPPFTGGVQATTCATPATLAGMMLIWADPNMG